MNLNQEIATLLSGAEFILPLAATILYGGFVYFGNAWMKHRHSAFQLKTMMMIYNVFQILLNAIMFGGFLWEILAGRLSLWGNSCFLAESTWITSLILMHYADKFVDLLDTVFMVLRKKTNQITFLHLFHHVLLIWSWYVVIKIAPQGDAYFGAMVNSFIHVIMYTYYLLASCNIPCPFKRYITRAQLLQFMIVATHSMFSLYHLQCGIILPSLQLFVMMTMLVLFQQFYFQAYRKNQNHHSSTSKQTDD